MLPVISPWGTSCVGKKKILLLLSDGQEIRILSGDFPDHTVDRAMGLHCQGPRFNPWSGN